MRKDEVIIISSCLAGVKCRYNGKDKKAIWFDSLKERYRIIDLCPEVLAGMKIPRSAMEFLGGDGEKVWSGEGKVINRDGEDVTELLKKGALRALDICKKYKVKYIILKEKSPSCGVHKVYYKDRGLDYGIGVWTYLLKKENYYIFNEEEFGDFLKRGL